MFFRGDRPHIASTQHEWQVPRGASVTDLYGFLIGFWAQLVVVMGDDQRVAETIEHV
jgi:hypothetical protein